MTEANIIDLIIKGNELIKIKDEYKGINPILTIHLKGGDKITYKLNKGFLGTRSPKVENGYLVFPSPKDENPDEKITDTQIIKTYHQIEDIIPCEEIVRLTYTYERPTYTAVTTKSEED